MRDREVDRKFPQIAADYEKNKAHFEYGTGELEILVPKKPQRSPGKDGSSTTV